MNNIFRLTETGIAHSVDTTLYQSWFDVGDVESILKQRRTPGRAHRVFITATRKAIRLTKCGNHRTGKIPRIAYIIGKKLCFFHRTANRNHTHRTVGGTKGDTWRATGQGSNRDHVMISRPPVFLEKTLNRRRSIVGSMLGQRRRRWTNIKPTLGQRCVFAGQVSGWNEWNEFDLLFERKDVLNSAVVFLGKDRLAFPIFY